MRDLSKHYKCPSDKAWEYTSLHGKLPVFTTSRFRSHHTSSYQKETKECHQTTLSVTKPALEVHMANQKLDNDWYFVIWNGYETHWRGTLEGAKYKGYRNDTNNDHYVNIKSLIICLTYTNVDQLITLMTWKLSLTTSDIGLLAHPTIRFFAPCT